MDVTYSSSTNGVTLKQRILGQKAVVLHNLLSQENFKDFQNILISIIPNPPAFSVSFASSLQTLSGLLFHKNEKNMFSMGLGH